ncbi:response regulator [Thalassovita gelatinovora]|uniref:Response regulator n=1 Tax=Thalassovita gelatinovora TaxID=53501 RepID=A0A0N7LUS5_THAGE|nr:helix-turn-helix transcriptional regulator [Thalassovita gelatinovora]QIZ80364.1 helix-turn-helix transcriptional regulator [Thalassovita gelatinovora]CUH64314.1 response regulator [Thalassovita gelatinovora]SEQ93449.1 regulatory protein, luxR family [Thalassovita gelatinovora]
MTALAQHIDTCLAALGRDGFAPAFADFVETLGVDQIMVFAIEGDRARCLLSRHFSHGALAGKLAATYLDGWFLQDPLLPALRQAAAGTVTLYRLEDFAQRMGAEYRRVFFDAPGLAAKTTMVAVGDRLRLFVSLYHTGDGTECAPDLARLAGRLALMHFERAAQSDTPEPLAVLSDRERAVCLGILSGRKADLIAADLGVAASTVVTYRKRAYGKLGITSRAGLFAICGK